MIAVYEDVLGEYYYEDSTSFEETFDGWILKLDEPNELGEMYEEVVSVRFFPNWEEAETYAEENNLIDFS